MVNDFIHHDLFDQIGSADSIPEQKLSKLVESGIGVSPKP